MRSLRGEAEAAIGVEDWFGAIQALQAALSLEPNNFEISARLKWANEQRKLSGLFTEAQELYDRGKKAAALQKFRQVRVAGGNYRGVNELMAQLEREVSTESRTLYRAALDLRHPGRHRRRVRGGRGAGRACRSGASSGARRTTRRHRPAARSCRPWTPRRNRPPARPAQRVADVPTPARRSRSRRRPRAPAPDSRPVGRYRAVQHDNQQMRSRWRSIPTRRSRCRPAPASTTCRSAAGSFAYNPSSGVLLIVGDQQPGRPLQRADAGLRARTSEHFHVMYAGLRWDLFPE